MNQAMKAVELVEDGIKGTKTYHVRQIADLIQECPRPLPCFYRMISVATRKKQCESLKIVGPIHVEEFAYPLYLYMMVMTVKQVIKESSRCGKRVVYSI